MCRSTASTGISEPTASARVMATTSAASPLEAFRDQAQPSPMGLALCAPEGGQELDLAEMSEPLLGDEIEQL
jgi:hypothetical protein